MNIILLLGTLSGLGGIETCIKTVCKGALANGDTMHAFALCPSTANSEWHEKISYSEIENNSRSLKWQMLRTAVRRNRCNQ